MNTRRTVLAGLAGLAGLSAVARLPASDHMSASVRTGELDFGFGTMARVLAPAGAAPALFICGGHAPPDRGAGPLAVQCAAAGFTAVTVNVPAARGRADAAWLPAAVRWVKDNQSSGRLAPGLVFLAGENHGAAGAFAWAKDFRRALGSTRLRAVLSINGNYGSSVKAEDIAALTDGDETSIVLISDGGVPDDSLSLGRELAALGAPFELHLFGKPEPGLPARANGTAQIQRLLHQPSAS
ncbi:MAG: hypothetical protein WB440_02730 [Steroidobacteraceae bacterium]|jgi:hypothetical protein